MAGIYAVAKKCLKKFRLELGLYSSDHVTMVTSFLKTCFPKFVFFVFPLMKINFNLISFTFFYSTPFYGFLINFQ